MTAATGRLGWQALQELHDLIPQGRVGAGSVVSRIDDDGSCDIQATFTAMC